MSAATEGKIIELEARIKQLEAKVAEILDKIIPAKSTDAPQNKNTLSLKK